MAYYECVLCNESYLKADMVELEDDSMVCRKCYESQDITFCGSCERICVDENMTRSWDALLDLFEKRFVSKRLGLVLLTQTGKSTEPLQGILTPWDFIGSLA